MARVLLLSNDTVLTAAIEDRLRPAGHDVGRLEDPAQAVSHAVEHPLDLAIVDMELPTTSGLEVVRALRRQPETRALPILLLADHGASADRVRALKAGADDTLTKPCDLDELVLRAEKLLGERAADPPLLQGSLASQPLWELLQNVEHSGKSGYLEVAGRRGSGRVQLLAGRVVGARWSQLLGHEAMLAILGTEEGHFRLTADASPPQPRGEAISIHQLLLEASWLEDQLSMRRASLPPTGVPLIAVEGAEPVVDDELADLPLREVLERVRAKPGCRLFDLLVAAAQAPQKVRLAVACLSEQGVLRPATSDAEAAVPTTHTLAHSALLDLTVLDLLRSARQAGRDRPVLPLLLLPESAALPRLREVLTAVPGVADDAPWHRLAERLEQEGSGSAVLPTDDGKLSVQVQPLADDARPKIDALLTLAGGVLVWLVGTGPAELLADVVRTVEAAPEPAVGVFVAATPGARDAAHGLLDGTERWRSTEHAPRSLVGLLRLFQLGTWK